MKLRTTLKKSRKYHTGAKKERNENLVKDYNNWIVLGNKTVADLVAKYRISRTVVYEILDYFVPVNELEEHDVEADELDKYSKELVEKYQGKEIHPIKDFAREQ